MLIQEYTLALLTTRPIMLSRRYEYYIVPNIQALSSVLVISHINEDESDQHASYWSWEWYQLIDHQLQRLYYLTTQRIDPVCFGAINQRY